MTTPARPPSRSQFSPLTATSSKDCVAATAAYLIWRATGGRVALTHDDVRAQSGAPATRGLYLSEAVKAAAHWGVELEATKISASLLYETVAGGAPVGVIVDCPPWVIFPGSTYDGPHMIYLQDASEWPAGEICACELDTASRHREYTVEDPGSTSAGYVQRSAARVERAANAASGATGMWVLVGPDTEGVYRTVEKGHYSRTQPSPTAPTAGWLTAGRRIYTTATVNTSGGPVFAKLAARYAEGAKLK